MTASDSSGKGLNFDSAILIRRIQDPALFNQDVERFYYLSDYGVRFSLKPVRGLRLSVTLRQESRQNDLGLADHFWRIGASVWNFPAGPVHRLERLNRGSLSENDSYYVSLTKDLGRFSLNASISNTFRGLRFDPVTGEPLPIAINDYQNIALGTLIRFGRDLSAQVEYGGFLRSGGNEHFLFVRLIYRSR